jgi:hypothetical protein
VMLPQPTKPAWRGKGYFPYSAANS